MGRSRGRRFGSWFAYGCVRLRGFQFQSFIQPTKLPRSVLSTSWSSPSSLCCYLTTGIADLWVSIGTRVLGGSLVNSLAARARAPSGSSNQCVGAGSGCLGGGQRGLGSSAGPTVSTPEGLMNLNSKKEGERGGKDKRFVSSRLGSVFPRPK